MTGLFEVRAARRRRESGLRTGLAISILLHLVAAFVLGVLPSRSRPVRWEGGAFEVSLSPLSIGSAGSGRPPARTEPESPAPVQPKPEPPEPKRLEGAVEVVPRSAGPPASASAPPAARVTPLDQEAEGPAGAGGSDEGSAGGGGPGGGLGMNAQFDEAFGHDYYMQALIAKISQAWRPPAGLAEVEGMSATLRFRITTQGRVPDVDVELPSGIELFDRSAVEAVRRAQPLPPFPPAYRGRWLTVHLKFTLQG
jgi:TonB family protein